MCVCPLGQFRSPRGPKPTEVVFCWRPMGQGGRALWTARRIVAKTLEGVGQQSSALGHRLGAVGGFLMKLRPWGVLGPSRPLCGCWAPHPSPPPSGPGYGLRTPRGGGVGGFVWGQGQPRPTPPHQKIFPPAKIEIYRRGRKFEADFRYTSLFFSLGPPKAPGVCFSP